MDTPLDAIRSRPLVDATRIDALRAVLKPDTLLRMITAFQLAIADQAAQTRTALAAGQTLDAIRLTHSLKGTSANFGADRLGALAGEMETLLKDGDTAAAATLIDAFLDTARQTEAALQEVQDQLRRQVDRV